MDFNDRRPVTVRVTLDRGALAALRDLPYLLHPDHPTTIFANAVRRGVHAMRDATIERESE